ncbi:ninjurin-2 isoform X2 [Chelonus insularis]|uniref:ninjurin-2 isoform X2 n=1 Tax=Chelonus insularis TaxID=460826 RepID=UPI0015888A5E|nr:ninjurin-2 isoform X2 [Chelonus insularis]
MSEHIEKPLTFGRNPSVDKAQINTFEKLKPSAPGIEESSEPEPKETDNNGFLYRKVSGSKIHNDESFDVIELHRTFSQEERDLRSAMNERKAVDVEVAEVLTGKSLDPNRYATKKTIAQGMLDIALLTANASQLKYILQVGKKHEFYTLMLSLICLSIGLQAVVGILFIIVGGLDINRRRDQWAANIINDIILIAVFVISLINVVISGFGMEFSNKPPNELVAYSKKALDTDESE